MKDNNHFTIIDNQEFSSEKNIILWSTYKYKEGQISILDFIEKNSEIIKKQYLDLINNLSHIKINSNQELYKIFNLKKDFSFWWTTIVYEKSFYKQLFISEILKLIALNFLLKNIKPKNILLKTSSQKLINSISKICQNQNIKFSYYKLKKKTVKKNIKDIKILIPKLLFSILNFIRFLSKRFSLKKIKTEELTKSSYKKLFCTYFAYLDYNKLKNGIYNSDYWNGLLDENREIIKNSLFLHIYLPNKNISYNESIKNLNKVNSNENNFHFFVDQFFSLKIFFKILKTWIRNIIKYKKVINKIKIEFSKKEIPIFYYLKHDLEESIIGTDSLVNLYYFYLFEQIAENLKNMKKCFYLCENQGWERSFVYNLKKKSKIIAVPHSTIRYWDLRYSNDLDKNKKYLYENFQPDFYAVNGDDSFNKLKINGFPINKMQKVEALRYSSVVKKSFNNLNGQNNNKVLIVGDYATESNFSLASTLNNINKNFLNKFSFTLKEHPLRNMSNLLKINFDETKKNISDLANDYRFAIVSNTTSAVVDLYLLDFKIICVLDENKINHSPLKGNPNVLFLHDKSLLVDYLEKLDKMSFLDTKKTDFFYYSLNFNLWNELINN